jgi:hypothetical protein
MENTKTDIVVFYRGVNILFIFFLIQALLPLLFEGQMNGLYMYIFTLVYTFLCPLHFFILYKYFNNLKLHKFQNKFDLFLFSFSVFLSLSVVSFSFFIFFILQ